MNILWHAQVAGGLCDARGVDLDAFGKVDINELDCHVLFPSGATWNSFVPIWKNSPDFYVDDDPVEDNNATPLVMSGNMVPHAENESRPLLL
ncbi:hypothetical protein J1N35_018440 [Gossypium stocksii]|uniref:Uncharacterized protein n=1 Tax=Gossypium stocksii TaxID=47602 RepID=A0A9D3VQP1_9ROSI|nr:hypothetical protein J1N35_018440 [Gossypium stocksii]